MYYCLHVQLDEDSKAGTVVGHFVTSDPDNANTVTQTHTYTLTDDAEGRFAVDGENLVVSDRQSVSLCAVTSLK